MLTNYIQTVNAPRRPAGPTGSALPEKGLGHQPTVLHGLMKHLGLGIAHADGLEAVLELEYIPLSHIKHNLSFLYCNHYTIL